MGVLIGDIVTGRLAPGRHPPAGDGPRAAVPRERGVARECVRGLDERGLVTVKHGRGRRRRGDALVIGSADLGAALALAAAAAGRVA
jgi:DNA-binding FadR family transcriptional regulator